MILIADSGSTKTDWCLLDGKEVVRSIKTQGFSPNYQTAEDITEKLRDELVPQLTGKTPSEIHYYGTGCSSADACHLVRTAIATVFPEAKINIQHDLLAAARALCGHHEGIACILGTGSNSCHFDGKDIVFSLPNLGFILGDEGSGGYLGKRLIQAYLNHELPLELHRKFRSQYNVDRDEIIENVYTKPFPNRYVASFARFLGENSEHPFIAALIHKGLDDFFIKNITRYENYENLPVHFVGSVAFYYAEELKAVAKKHNVTIGKMLENPMEGLIQYHIHE